MKKLRKVKAYFSKADLKKYKKLFVHKQIRFIFSKVSLIFKKDIEDDFLYKGEQMIMLSDKNKKMFVKAFKTLDKKIDGKIDWESFGKLIWYSFQTSTYWKDSKKGIKNIFTKNNFVEINEEKRSYYYKWLDSIPKELDQYNIKISNTLKAVF